jgi:beta-N-acetylhexosaminidase
LAGFHGTAPPAELEVAIVRGVIGGVIYFARNIVAPDQVAEMSARLQAIAPWPLFIAIDQEGGSVQRLRAPFVELPPMAALGARGDAGLAERVGRLLGRELRTVGVNWDFAPVLDVDTNPANPVIGKRSFGRDPALVAALGVALARGLEGEGIVSCGKHFPGHGDTHQDSHHTLPTLPHGLERLREIELPPFAAYGRAGLASIMTAHVLFPALDASLPATLSPSILRLLRDELSFDGLIVSDDLEMKAVSEQYAVEALVTRGVAAGIDVFLVCSDFEGALRASRRVRDLARDSPAACASIERSLRRLDALCTRFGLPHEIPAPAERASILGCEAHRRVLEEILAQKTGVD